MNFRPPLSPEFLPGNSRPSIGWLVSVRREARPLRTYETLSAL